MSLTSSTGTLFARPPPRNPSSTVSPVALQSHMCRIVNVRMNKIFRLSPTGKKKKTWRVQNATFWYFESNIYRTALLALIEMSFEKNGGSRQINRHNSWLFVNGSNHVGPWLVGSQLVRTHEPRWTSYSYDWVTYRTAIIMQIKSKLNKTKK